MVPKSIVESGLDDGCVRLYAYLDRVQGNNGHPARGFAATGEDLGLQPRTVSSHAHHLCEFGVIALEGSTGDGGHGKEVMRVIYNPARRRWPPTPVQLPERTTRYRKPSTAPKFATERDAARKEGRAPRVRKQTPRGERRTPDPGTVESVPALDAGPNLRSPRAGEAERGARDAPLLRSMRSESSSHTLITNDCEDNEQLVVGRCELCDQRDAWWVLLPDGVELRMCNDDRELAKLRFPQAQIVSLASAEGLKAPFQIPPEGARGAALAELRAARDAAPPVADPVDQQQGDRQDDEDVWAALEARYGPLTARD